MLWHTGYLTTPTTQAKTMASAPCSNIQHRQIRLLDISPGSFDHPISYIIRTVSLKNGIEYDLLPYVWGDLDERQIVSVSGLEVRVTKDLANALRFLRAGRICKMWIDGIS